MAKTISVLNPYIISWIMLVPKKGVATKSDAKKASRLVSNNNQYFSQTKNTIFTHSPNKAEALKKISLIKGKLDKQYMAYIVTDKQFGLSTKDNPDIIIAHDGAGVKLTSKQKSDGILV